MSVATEAEIVRVVKALDQEVEGLQARINKALEIARDGTFDGAHHKMWVIDQMVRALTGCPMQTFTAKDAHGQTYSFEGMGASEEYTTWVAETCDGEDGPDTYPWDVGMPP